MPGTIRVSVLEAVDLPEIFTDGFAKDVTAKVTLGTRQFETLSRVAVEGRIESWNSDFVFLVTNLRDNLVVAICNNENQCLTQTSIEVPSIIEKGCRDEFVELKGGGRIHLNMSFVLTDEERKKIESMRLRVHKRREEERVKRTIVFKNVQCKSENELKAATFPAVTITEIDDSSTHVNKVSHEIASGPLGFGSTTKPLKPIVTFDYARAVGLQSRQACKRTAGSTFRAAETGRDEPGISVNDDKEDKLGLEGQRKRNVLEADAAIIANSFSDQPILDDEQSSSGFQGVCPHMTLNHTQSWGRQRAIRAVSSHKDIAKLEDPFSQCQKLEVWPGPGARWAQKTGLETRWTTHEKARQSVRFEWNGQIPDPFKARAKILKLIKAVSGSHEACGDDQRLEERHSLANSIGDVFNKVVGGAAILLVALFTMWPIPEGPPLGSDGSNECDTDANAFVVLN